MSDNVKPLFAKSKVEPTPELKAQYLEGLAARLRSGELKVRICVFVAETDDGECMLEPFGGEMSSMELAGMLSFANFMAIAK